jgi:sugar (pentulose or hexulose) kinase
MAVSGHGDGGAEGLTVGLDIGSSALKAVVADASGRVVASLRRRHRLVVPTPDRMEHHALPAWREAPRRVLAQVTAGLHDVRAVCVAGIVPSLAAVDARGIPRSPGLLYGDARGGAAITPLQAGDRGEADSAYPTGHAPDLLRSCALIAPGAAGYWPAQAVANHALTGSAVVDVSTALAMAPLYDGQSWSTDSVRGAGVDPCQLPAVRPLGDPIGRWRDVTVASGIVDTLAEQLVAGASEDGDVLVVCGSTLVVWCVTSEWRQVTGLWTVPHTTPGKVLIGGASNAGGLFLDWARSLTGPASGAISPNAHVPVWAPYPRGERTPLHDRARRAMLVDLQVGDDRAALRRAGLEATGFVVRRHIELAGVPARRLVATGGGAHDAEWMQALADTTELPVDVVAVPEGGALGAAFIARMAAGLEGSLSDAGRWAAVRRRFEPDAAPGATASVAARYGLFIEVSGWAPGNRAVAEEA